MIRAIWTAARRIARRPVLWALVWSYRDVITLWVRSLQTELQHSRRIDGERMRQLLSRLWRLTKESGMAVRVGPHEVRIADEAPVGFHVPEGYDMTERYGYDMASSLGSSSPSA